jgi:PAS domain S-box-containing protein
MKDDPISEGISHPDQSADAIEGCRFENDRQLLEAIFEASPECIKIVAPDGRLVRMNPSGLGMVEVEPGAQVEGTMVLSLIAPEFRDAWQANHERVCKGERLMWTFDIIGLRGTRRRMETHAVPIRLLDGQIGQLSITRDITVRRENELKAARLAAIIASSDDAIVSKTLDGIVTTWNAGAEKIFGYTADEIIGQPITRIIPPELHYEEEEILARIRRGLHIDHFETVRLAKDGRRIDVSVTISPMRDKSGNLIGASKVGRDITERKHAEGLQQLLIGELNHRVKNTLATVQSIANQTVHRAKSPSDFAASFGGRLQSLAKTHSLLTQSTWQGAELSELIRDQLPFGDGEDERITCSGPLVMLNAQAALHLSLVLHELATNAIKHGALSDRRGRLSIRWMVRTETERKLVLQWQERGGPTVTVPQSRGFGTTLIEKSLEAHGGVTSIRYEAEGVTCEVILPLPETETSIGGSYHRPPTEGPQAVKGLKSSQQPNIVAGKRILVVDDEPLIAMDMVASLEDEGCEIVGPATTLRRALTLVETEDIDAALLDANLAGDPVDELAAVLVRRGIPFAFVSGYGREGLPQAYQEMPLIRKPFQRQRLIDVVREMVIQDSIVVPFRKTT